MKEVTSRGEGGREGYLGVDDNMLLIQIRLLELSYESVDWI
jgi:hypothetical protein